MKEMFHFSDLKVKADAQNDDDEKTDDLRFDLKFDLILPVVNWIFCTNCQKKSLSITERFFPKEWRQQNLRIFFNF